MSKGVSVADLELRLEGDLNAARSTLVWMGTEATAGEVNWAVPTLEAPAIQLQEAVIEVHPEVRSQVQPPKWADLPTRTS